MSVSRRKFIATTAAATTIGMTRVHRAFANQAPNIRVAVIGFNDRGSSHIKALGNHVVALCDVDEKILSAKADELKDKLGRPMETYTDFRKLLENKNIDAVTIATPNHTHALITIAAAQAGKDVYVEKPVSHNIWEGRQMVAAAKKYDRIIQCGTQSRSNPSIRSAVEFIQSGQLGEIRYVQATDYKPRPSIGKSSTPFEFPQSIDKDLWLGPASDEPFYRPEINTRGTTNPHYDWHWDFNTGNGDLCNQGIHEMDIARWFLAENSLAPRAISIGGRLGYDDAGNTPNTQVALLDYEKAPLIFETRGLPRSKAGQKNWGKTMDNFRGSQIGVIVQCEKGYVLVQSWGKTFAFDHQGQPVKEWERGSGYGTDEHFENWLAAIESHDRSALNAEIHEGHLSSSLCHLAGISHRLGEKMATAEIAEYIRGNELLSNSFDRMASHLRANDVEVDRAEESLDLGPWLELDTVAETFRNNEAANALRKRKQRKPFVVPEVEGEQATTAAKS